MVRECDFDLRGLNPKKGDLVLLVDGELEFEHSKLLAVFDRFVEQYEEKPKGIVVQLFGVAQPCDFSAEKAVYLKPPINLDGICFPVIEKFPEYRAINIIYITEEGYVGRREIISALRKERGFEIYATVIESQLASSLVTTPSS